MHYGELLSVANILPNLHLGIRDIRATYPGQSRIQAQLFVSIIRVATARQCILREATTKHSIERNFA